MVRSSEQHALGQRISRRVEESRPSESVRVRLQDVAVGIDAPDGEAVDRAEDFAGAVLEEDLEVSADGGVQQHHAAFRGSGGFLQRCQSDAGVDRANHAVGKAHGGPVRGRVDEVREDLHLIRRRGVPAGAVVPPLSPTQGTEAAPHAETGEGILHVVQHVGPWIDDVAFHFPYLAGVGQRHPGVQPPPRPPVDGDRHVHAAARKIDAVDGVELVAAERMHSLDIVRRQISVRCRLALRQDRRRQYDGDQRARQEVARASRLWTLTTLENEQARPVDRHVRAPRNASNYSEG